MPCTTPDPNCTCPSPIGPEPATGSPDLRAAWHEARAALNPHREAAEVRHLTDGQSVVDFAAAVRSARRVRRSLYNFRYSRSRRVCVRLTGISVDLSSFIRRM